MLKINPKITVLMSVYNGEKFLRESIESILNQRFYDYEFLIINDGSDDSTPDILERYARRDSRILVIYQANMGFTRSLNRGLELARGEYIARQDADDVSMPDRIEKQISLLQTRPELCMVGSWAEIIDENNKRIDIWRYPCSHAHIHWNLLFRNCLVHSSVVFNKGKILSYGGYNYNIRYAQDYELWSRLVLSERFQQIPEVLVRRRIISKSIGSIYETDQEDIALEVSRRNISKVLNREVSLQEVCILRDVLDRKAVSKQEIEWAIKFFSEIYKKFITLYELSSEINEIKVAYIWRLLRMMRFKALSVKMLIILAQNSFAELSLSTYKKVPHILRRYL